LGFVHFLFELDLLSLRILSEGDKTKHPWREDHGDELGWEDCEENFG
jgi:hypothetical protein